MGLDRILVTGAEGFVGHHLVPALRAEFPGAGVIGSSRTAEHGEALDVTDAEQACEIFARLQPDVCVHLAGVAAINVARSHPRQTWEINLHGSLNVANAILASAPQCRLIFISSAECYGASFKTGLALSEDASLAPMNLYAATKASAEMALGVLAGEGLRLLRLRPFNHTGPGQSEDFVVPAFAGQIARIEAGRMAPQIAVGALEPERDFIDIRDICGAYAASIRNFDSLPPNSVINIASGNITRIGAILDRLLANATRQISIRQDPARLRPVEIPRALGCADQARGLLGWQPRYALEDTLKTVLTFARQQIAAQAQP